MFKNFFRSKKEKKEIELKTLAFFQFSKSIGAIETPKVEQITISELLLESFLFLDSQSVVSKNDEKKLLIFMDQYNRFLEYCIKKKLVKKNECQKIEQLELIKVPDMSHIQVPDISKELKEMNIDLDQLSQIFSHMDLRKSNGK